MKTTPRRDSFAAMTDERYSDMVCPVCGYGIRRGEATTVKTKNGPVTKVSFVDYEAHNYPAKDEWLYSSFWYKDFDGMAHKTMLRQLISKWGIMSIDLQTAFTNDDAVLNVNDSGEFIRTEEAPPKAALPEPDGELDKHQEDQEAPAQQEEQVSLDDV